MNGAWPNPAHDQITLALTTPVQNAALMVVDMAGRTVQVEIINGDRSTLDVKQLPQGLYAIHMDGVGPLVRFAK